MMARSVSTTVVGLVAALCLLAPKLGASNPRIDRILNDALTERMTALKVPGISIAVIRNGQLDWARGLGVTRIDGPRVTVDTVFQAASISKAVTALGVMYLIETGKLKLDAPANDYLRTWKIPDNEFTAQAPVTIRELLSHTAGLNVHAFSGYETGSSLPTTIQILEGQPPANNAAIRVEATPGTAWRYSGGGYTVLQQLMSDATAEPFPALMHRIVLQPLRMSRSTFEQTLPTALSRNAASASGSNGEPVKGGAHRYPEMAAAGLWTTPTDLARFALEIQRAAAGKLSVMINSATASAMLTPQLNNWGLGLQLGQPGKGYFNHGGGNEGFRCLLVASEDGNGAVIMANSEGGADELVMEVLRAIATEYQWANFQYESR